MLLQISWLVWPIIIISLGTALLTGLWLMRQLVSRCVAMLAPSKYTLQQHRERVLWCAMTDYVQGKFIKTKEEDLAAMLDFVKQEVAQASCESKDT